MLSVAFSLLAAAFAALAAGCALAAWRAHAGALARLRLLGEQTLAAQRTEADTTRERLSSLERALTTAIQTGMAEPLRRAFGEVTSGLGEVKLTLANEQGALRLALAGQFAENRTLLEGKLRELREGNEAKLAEIQKSVNEQLQAAVATQMTNSFNRVIDQFNAVQKAMVDVQAVTAQIGDIKRLFSNVKTRGGWGETQVRAMLDDVLPPGSYETNRKLREDSDEAVEFAVVMPMRGTVRTYLPVDAKFPVEDYERLLAAAEAGDSEAERLARRGLEQRIRAEAKKIQGKYINPPLTVEFAVMYLATDGLYAEVARIPGMIEEIGRLNRVLVLGPSLFPALLRTIQLGHVTLTLERKADEVRALLGATLTEMQRMDEVLAKLGKQAGTFSTTIEAARVRTRVMQRKLRGVEAADAGEAARLLEIETEADSAAEDLDS